MKKSSKNNGWSKRWFVLNEKTGKVGLYTSAFGSWNYCYLNFNIFSWWHDLVHYFVMFRIAGSFKNFTLFYLVFYSFIVVCLILKLLQDSCLYTTSLKCVLPPSQSCTPLWKRSFILDSVIFVLFCFVFCNIYFNKWRAGILFLNLSICGVWLLMEYNDVKNLCSQPREKSLFCLVWLSICEVMLFKAPLWWVFWAYAFPCSTCPYPSLCLGGCLFMGGSMKWRVRGTT